jgi:hypothetical protein
MLRIAKLAAILVMTTSSFDLFMVVQIGGTFRFCHLMALVLVALAAIRIVAAGEIPTLGALPLFAWWIIQLLFVPVTEFWIKSMAYCSWLLLDLALVISFVQLFSGNPGLLNKLLHWYLYSFGLVAAFGIIQFLLPLAGLPTPFAVEWWIPERVIRVNGLSYEPSYFATYLLLGFVLIRALKVPSNSSRIVYWLIVAAILVSSSRLGIVFMLLDILCSYVPKLLSIHRQPIRIKKVLVAAVISVFTLGAAAVLKNNPETIFLFLGGTGLYGSPAHSVIERENSFIDTLTVFENHPFMGRSLGGISYAIGELHGQRIASFKDSKLFEGMSIFGEALAASGAIGILPFLVFVGVTTYKPLQLARSAPPYYSAWLRALVRALAFEWAILQFNQNILRPYLWVHIAILATVYAAALKAEREARVTRVGQISLSS